MKKKSILSSLRSHFYTVLITLLFSLLYSNNLNAQSGTVSSNSDQLCVGISAEFSTNAWAGGTWSSSNPSVLKVEPSGNNARATGVSTGTADVIYTVIVNSNVYTSKKTITVSNQLGAIGEISGAQPQCANTSNQIYSISSVANATSYQWKVPGDWKITSGQNTNSITVTVGTSNGNVEVQASNACASSGVKYKSINVLPRITSVPVATGATNIQCSYTQLNWNTVSNADGYLLDISTNSSFTEFVSGYNNRYVPGNNSSFGSNDLPSGILYYRVRAMNTCTTTQYSNAMTFQTSAPHAGAVSLPQSICSGTSAKISVTGSLGSVQWQQSQSSTGPWINISGATSINYTTPNLTQNTYYRVVVNNGNCSPATSSSTLVSVNQPSTVGVISNDQTICSGSSANISVKGSVGSVQWQQSQSGTGVWSDISGATSVNYTTPDLTQNTYYRVVVTNGSCAAQISTPVLIAVNQNVAMVLQPIASATYCQNMTSSNLSISATGTGTLTYQWYSNKSNSNTGGTLISGATSVNYTPPTASVGTVFYYVVVSGSCGSDTSNVSAITVSPKLEPAVAISPSTAIICPGANTPIKFIANPSDGGSAPNYQWQVNGGNVGTNSATFTSTTLAAGDVVKVVMTSNATPCLANSQVTSNAIVIKTETAVYNGSWITKPEPNLSAEIRSDYTPEKTNLEVCALVVTNNAKVTIKSGSFFKIQNDLTVNSGSSLTIESDANLIQVNEGVNINTGDITAKRNITLSPGRQQYNYLISPLEGYSLANIYKDANGVPVKVPFVLYHNEANNTFGNSSGAYIKGRGLAVKEPTSASFTATNMSAKFIGKPTNGAFTYTIINSKSENNSRGFNLIGNPYPSNIDLVKFYSLNGGKSGNMDSTAYFWDNKANSKTSQEGDSYGGQAYGQLNLVHGTGVAGTGDKNIGKTQVPTQYVKTGQGFMVRSKVSSAIIQFNNTIRTEQTGDTAFFGKNIQKGEVSRDRYWLNMTSSANIASNIAVVYLAEGNDLLAADDSRSMGGSDAVYSIVEGEKVSINGRSSFSNSDKVSLGSQHYAAGIYTIALGDKEGVFADTQSIYLKDKQTGIITNLSQGAYTFNAEKGDSINRFEIIYQPGTVLVTDNKVKDGLVVYKDGNNFVITSSSDKITDVEVYDAVGRLVYKIKPNSKIAQFASDHLSTGIYVLKISQGNQITSKKVIK